MYLLTKTYVKKKLFNINRQYNLCVKKKYFFLFH